MVNDAKPTPTITSAEFRADTAAAFRLAKQHGCLTIVGEDGQVCARLWMPTNAIETEEVAETRVRAEERDACLKIVADVLYTDAGRGAERALRKVAEMMRARGGPPT